MFKRKWYWVLTPLLIFTVGGSLLFLNLRTANEPVKIYKAVTPTSKASPTRTYMKKSDITTLRNHGHSHEPVPHSHAEGTNTSNSGYDWQEDSVFEAPLSTTDPWKQTYPEQKPTEADDTYPPRDWHKTEDPELYTEYLRAQLLKQFGDIPEVHIIAEDARKRRLEITPTQDEFIAYLEALYHLWPSEQTLRTLERHRRLKAEKAQVNITYKRNPK